MNESIFSRPASEWTDDEMRVGLEELARMIQWKDDQHQDTVDLREWWIKLDDERKKRKALADQVDEAANPTAIRAPVRILLSPGERRAMRRRRQRKRLE
jgi:hypothetical protein